MQVAMIRPGAIFLASSGPAPATAVRSGVLRRTVSALIGWLGGRNRKRESSRSLVPRDVLLRQVRPIRNDLEEGAVARGTRSTRLVHESARVPVQADDQDHAWNRLRNRRQSTLVVFGD